MHLFPRIRSDEITDHRVLLGSLVAYKDPERAVAADDITFTRRRTADQVAFASLNKYAARNVAEGTHDQPRDILLGAAAVEDDPGIAPIR
jgi:hypothetical protein